MEDPSGAELRRAVLDSGEASPRRPFGHSADGSGIVEVEAAAIREAAQQVLAGATLSSVVREWNLRGLTTAAGGPWRVNSLSTLLVQPRLAGLRGDGSPAPTALPIIDVGIHAQLVALHASRSKGGRRATKRYLLTGLLRCWRCKGVLRGMPRAGRADLYVCPGPPHGGCSGTAVTADHADDAIRDLVLAHLTSAKFLQAVGDPRSEHLQERALERAANRIATIQHRLGELADIRATGELGRPEWLSLKRTLDRQAKQVEAEMQRLSRVEVLRSWAKTGGPLGPRWSVFTVEDRRAILHAVLDHVVVLAAAPPRHVFRPERLRPVWLEHAGHEG